MVAAPYVPDRRHRHAGGAFLTRYVDGLVGQGEDVTLVAPVSVDEAARGQREHHVTIQVLASPGRAARAACLPLDVRRAPTLGHLPVRSARRAEVRRAFSDADVIELQWSETLALLPGLEALGVHAPVLAFEHDVLFRAVHQRARFGRSATRRMLDRARTIGMEKREVALLNRTQHVRVFSEAEAQLLRDAGVEPPVSVAPPSVWLPSVVGRPVAEPTVLFVGWWARPENDDAARWLLSGPWSAILARHPQARLVLAGADPSPSLRKEAERSPGVEVTGELDDLDRAYGRARVVVVPNRSGGGLKFKVAEAMGHGLPVVATASSARGYIEHGAPLVVADGADRFAEEVVRLLEPGSSAELLGAAARSWVMARYDFDAFVSRTVELHRELSLSRR